MTNKKPSFVDQLRGATRLAADATRGVTDLVEAMHHTIGGGPQVLGRPLETVTKLLTTPAYGVTRQLTTAVEVGLDAALGALAPLVDQSGQERSALQAALNGVLGDYLVETSNPLAIQMRLCDANQALELAPDALSDAFPRASGRLLVLVHGSSMPETCWTRNGHNHGEGLADVWGSTLLYLRYNSGLHVSHNGRSFAALLQTLVECWPVPVEEIVFVAHSMGGLVSRSACVFGERASHGWRDKLGGLVTLGTPHHGAPLERGGNWVDVLLEASRYSAPLVKLGQLRSAGVTDLRYGNLLDEDWQGRGRFEMGDDPRQPVPLPDGVRCFAVAATVGSDEAPTLGDGLVPVDSALGHHKEIRRRLAFSPENRLVVANTSHNSLLDSQPTYEQLLDWLRPR